jgi:ABC-type transport system involved in Fe-S cluster assembly fused permease/ATPase subunit
MQLRSEPGGGALGSVCLACGMMGMQWCVGAGASQQTAFAREGALVAVDLQRTRAILRDFRDVRRLICAATDAVVRRNLLLTLIFVVVTGALSATGPIVLKLIIDALGMAGRSPTYVSPALLVAIYIAIEYLGRCLGAVEPLAHAVAEQRLRRHVSRRMFAHVMALPLRFHLDRSTGAIGETLAQGLSGYQILLRHLINTLLPVGVEFITIAVVLVHFGHATYLWILALAAIGYAVGFGAAAGQVAGPTREVSSAQIAGHSMLTDTLINYEAVKYFSAEAMVCNRYDSVLARAESAWRAYFRCTTSNGVLIATIFTVSLGGALSLATREVMQGRMSVGDFVLINSYVVRLVQPLEQIGYAVRDMSQGVSLLQRLLGLFRESQESGYDGRAALDDAQAPISHPNDDVAPNGGSLVFDKVTFSYNEHRPVLKDVSFAIPAGKTLAIVGVSGSGKSSLIRLLFRLYEPDSGRILLDGVPVTELPLSSLRQAIAVVPQDTVLFNDSIGRNLAFGRYGASQQEIEQAARLARIHELIIRLPDGYSTQVGERGLKLSGGERQRVAIARAALKRPRIFVFDEATSSLDSKTEREILQNLIEVSRRSTTVVIAHRLSTVVHADEILVLDAGVVIERGAHTVLVQQRGAYAGLWQAQQIGSGTSRDRDPINA